MGKGYRCKSCNVKRRKLHRNLNPEKERQRERELYAQNAEKIRKRKREAMKLAYPKRREILIQRVSKYKKERMKTDGALRAIVNARRRTRGFLKNKAKFSKKLGCSFEEFKVHIESQFQPGMTWDNYGEWHIDHKYPLSIAYKEGAEAFEKACNYKNLQPLWGKENIQKGNRLSPSNLY